jgi:SAM-dependent methyltransferase
VTEPDYVAVNREGWTRANKEYTDARAREAWAQDEITWGKWSLPESEVRGLPEVTGKEIVELGCGTGYFGAWLKRLGASRVVGVDVTPAQLETAQRMNEEFGLGLEFLLENAERTACRASSFDIVFSEYGASIWCDPKLWLAEAARLLRPGGELIFFRGSTLQMLCVPEEGPVAERLVRPQRGLYRLEWFDDDPGVEFHASTSEMFALLRENGFELLDFRELFAPEDAVDHEYYDTVPAAWAKRWPDEELWHAVNAGERAARPPLLLASRSPQRRAILEQLAIPFEAVVPQYDEELTGAESGCGGRAPCAGQGALGGWNRRRSAGARGRHRGRLDGRVYGKPVTKRRPKRCWRSFPADARGRLRALPADAAWEELRHAVTRVSFRR